MTKSNFPKDFLWGGALSACQAEGAYNVDGKSLTIPEVMKFNEKNDRKVTKQIRVNWEMIEEARNDPDTVKYPKRRELIFIILSVRISPCLPRWDSKYSVIRFHGPEYFQVATMPLRTKRH